MNYSLKVPISPSAAEQLSQKLYINNQLKLEVIYSASSVVLLVIATKQKSQINIKYYCITNAAFIL